ncbi:YfhO family protein [Sporosarcina soli]|uniref:YfhO family protein n=1 Tax=Sporosarcina soli TaxID=334736 RepID=A0ABW0TSB2_9BACL
MISKKVRKTFSKPSFLLVIGSLLIAITSHLFFLMEWTEGRYMTGPGDGLSQMLPFKQLLYQEYVNGNFFYSANFGYGGGTLSQLGYYFSTSIFFHLTVLITFILVSVHILQEPTLFYWADSLLVISIIRVTLIIVVTTRYFRFMKLDAIPAFIGASVYGTSVIYFRHVTYWEFFADAMVWLPLLLFGVEKIIREQKLGWFIFGVAINLMDNFYFSYVNFLLCLFYIIARWIISLERNEVGKLRQTQLFLVGGVAGLGISAIFFIPSVYGYLHNYRPPYEGSISLFEAVDNPLLNGRVIVLPAFVVLCIFLFSFYRNRLFRLFACLTILSTILHFSPQIGSMFNGFSAPQYRWEYFLSLMAGGVVAAALQMIKQVKMRELGIALMAMALVYSVSFIVDPKLSISSWKGGYLAISAVIVSFLLIWYGWKRDRLSHLLLALSIALTSVYVANIFQEVKLSNAGNVKDSSRSYMMSDAYNGEDQRELIQRVQAQENDPNARIDWMTDTRNNTPIVQEFKGMSVYSSILNEHLLHFYLFDLAIDMGRESVSRYASLGDRANLYSILEGKYMIAHKDQTSIPYGFEKLFTSGDYIAYKNDYILPFVRTTDTVFSEKDFNQTSPIAKERAMLDGIILKDAPKGQQEVIDSPNLIDQVSFQAVGGTYENDLLEITEEEGGLDLLIENGEQTVGDYYVSFYLRSVKNNRGSSESPDELFLMVNEYETSRKINKSIYKTNVDDLTIRVAKNERIAIRLPKGRYQLKDLKLYEEDYTLLRAVKERSNSEPDVPVKWERNTVEMTYDNRTGQTYMALPIPFEKGWNVYVNGQKKKLHQANFAFIGIELEDGMNDIKLVYYPPYFFLGLFITGLTFGLLFIFSRRKVNKEIPLH